MKYLPYILIAFVIFLTAGFYIDSMSPSSSFLPFEGGRQGGGEKLTDNAMLKNYGQAPEFTGIVNWLNSNALTMQKLRGKVVLIDFWTYSCINCIRTLPYVTKWYDAYKDKGFVVVGVHTPEFEFEKVTENVATAIKRHNINYPVAQDNNFATWNAYSNRYWPAKYLIDKEGNIRYTHFGEGKYDVTENAIRQLLGIGQMANNNNNHDYTGGQVKTPEIYFGLDRLANLSNSQKPTIGGMEYTLPNQLNLNQFALEGLWEFSPDHATCQSNGCKIKLKFHAGKVHMVASGHDVIILKVIVDGKPQPDVAIKASQLYTLFDSEDYREHEILIELYPSRERNFPADYFRAFTFTFG